MYKVSTYVVCGLLCLLPSISESYVAVCVNKPTCSNYKFIANNPAEISSALWSYRPTSVDLSGNLLEQLGNVQFNNVQVLNLSYNLLEEIALNSNKLQILDLTYNSLSQIELPRTLKTFFAKRNKLHSITFAGSSELVDLILPQNQFDSLAPFSKLQNLKTLDLSCNRITELSFATLSQLRQLEILHLGNNLIYTADVLAPMPKLHTITLSHNYLSGFEPTQNSLPNIKVLKLDNNHLVIALEDIKNIRQLSIRKNDWFCPKLSTMVERNTIVDRDEGDCTTFRNICCKHSQGPYADRVIDARHQQFRKIEQGKDLNCQQYKPSVCDGDDNKIYEVAQGILTQGLHSSQSSAQQLNATIIQKENILYRKQVDLDKENALFNRLHKELVEVEEIVNEEYSKLPPEETQGLSIKDKLNFVINAYNKKSVKTREDINSEERKEQDIVDDLAKVQEELVEVKLDLEDIEGKVADRNATIIGYENEIAKLEKMLETRQQNSG